MPALRNKAGKKNKGEHKERKKGKWERKIKKERPLYWINMICFSYSSWPTFYQWGKNQFWTSYYPAQTVSLMWHIQHMYRQSTSSYQQKNEQIKTTIITAFLAHNV